MSRSQLEKGPIGEEHQFLREIVTAVKLVTKAAAEREEAPQESMEANRAICCRVVVRLGKPLR